MNAKPKQQFATRAVHAGERVPAGRYTPVVTPIHPSVGYLYESMDEMDAVFAGSQAGYVYPRYASPTVSALETAVAVLEGAPAAHAFATGMAALHITLLAAGARAGRNVVAAFDLYGATFSLLRSLLAELNISARFVDATNHSDVE